MLARYRIGIGGGHRDLRRAVHYGSCAADTRKKPRSCIGVDGLCRAPGVRRFSHRRVHGTARHRSSRDCSGTAAAMYRVRDDGEHGVDGGERQGGRAMAIDYRAGIPPRHNRCRSAFLGRRYPRTDAALLPRSRHRVAQLPVAPLAGSIRSVPYHSHDVSVLQVWRPSRTANMVSCPMDEGPSSGRRSEEAISSFRSSGARQPPKQRPVHHPKRRRPEAVASQTKVRQMRPNESEIFTCLTP